MNVHLCMNLVERPRGRERWRTPISLSQKGGRGQREREEGKKIETASQEYKIRASKLAIQQALSYLFYHSFTVFCVDLDARILVDFRRLYLSTGKCHDLQTKCRAKFRC